MGYGTKTAYNKRGKPRALNLDATYRAIIEPAVVAAGLRCVRSDQVLKNGLIDKRMYEMLLRADLVIADISTGNVNAVYELGVRHALRPHSTILMQEDKAAFAFDLSHTSTFTYRHMGEDIGASEAEAKRAGLTKLIKSVLNPPTQDSPVYAFLDGLREPEMSDEDYNKMLTVIDEQGDGLGRQLEAGRAAMKASDFGAAISAFQLALEIIDGSSGSEDDPEAGQSDLAYVVQQLALATYKSKKPDEIAALHEGLKVIQRLQPADSQDTETLGITGAMHKRLWKKQSSRKDLDLAIEYYGRGFQLQGDYYNGENYAGCLDDRAPLHDDEDDRAFDRVAAKRARKAIISWLETMFASEEYDDRPDKMWMHATAANTLFNLGRDDEAQVQEQKFMALTTADWERETYQAGKDELMKRRQPAKGS